jgi:glucose/arabinose dehydrogenase
MSLPGYEDKTPPVEVTAPEIEFQAHSANLGIDFYNGSMFPAEYKGDAFVAQHGSWNRTSPVGYQIVRVRFDEAGNAIGTEPFATGWLVDGAAFGRPVDLEELPDGSLLISDDFAGVVYRISYEG